MTRMLALGNIGALGHLRAAGLPDLPWKDRMRFWSFRLRLLLGAVWVVGFVRILVADGARPAGSPWPYLLGIGIGAAAAIAGLVVADRRTKARAEAELPPDDTFED